MRLATASINTTALDLHTNASLVAAAMQAAEESSVDCLLLPELCLTGYGCDDHFFSDDFLAQTLERLLALKDNIPAKSKLLTVVGLPLLFKGLRYNVAACLTAQGILGIYAKQHLADYGVHYESRWFSPWPADHTDTIHIAGQDVTIGDQCYQWCGHQIGIEICQDAWVADRPARRYAKRGASVILNPSASHFARAKQAQRLAIVQEGSTLCQGTYAYCNLVGCESGRMIYDGANLIANKGRWLIQKAAFDFCTMDLQWTDLKETSAVHAQLLSDDDSLLQATALGLWDWQRKTKQRGFVVSLSGGADSALCAVLVYLAHRLAWHHMGTRDYLQSLSTLGLVQLTDKLTLEHFEQCVMPQVLTTVYQQTQHNSSQTKQAAKSLADALGCTHYQWEIDDLVSQLTDKVMQSTGVTLEWQTHDVVLQNIQARMRAPGPWCLANLEQKLLIATSNLSEATVGYCTMDGDTSGVLAPIGGLAKTTVQHLNRYLAEQGMLIGGQRCRIKALDKVNQLPPSAELRPQPQYDEADLPPYEVMDYLRTLIHVENLSPRQWLEKLRQHHFSRAYTVIELQSFAEQFQRLYARNQWKRERLAPSFHLEHDSACPKTYRRFPILNALVDE